MKGFADRLRGARAASGLTQEQLGFALSVTKSSISAWENGRETPSFRVLPQLCEVLGRSLDELVCGRPSATREEPKRYHLSEVVARDAGEEALLLRYRRMSAPRRKALLELMRPLND
jgi:transcriptional regulator with XRE-family HTH domain